MSRPMSMSATASGTPPARTPIAGFVIAATLGVGAAAHAEPLSIVQTLRNGEDGTVLPSVVHKIETNGDQVIVSSSGRLQLFTRDPASGALTLADSLVEYDSEAPVAEGDVTLGDGIGVLEGDLLVVNGGQRDPALCDVSPSCTIFGPLALSTANDRFAVVGISDDGDGESDDLTVSPDGRHAYALGGRGGAAGLTVFSLDESGSATVVEILDDEFLLGDRRGIEQEVEFSLDGRFLFLAVNETGPTNMPSDAVYIVTLARDAESGRITRSSEVEVTAGPDGLKLVEELTAAPDGVTLFGAAGADDPAESGLVRYAIAADGALTRTAIDSSPNESESASLAFPDSVAISPNGRLVLVANTIESDDNEEALHLFTVGDDGATTWRGFEQSNADGLLEDDLKAIEHVRFSPDGAYVHVLSGFTDEGVLNTFAAHADNVTTIEAPTNALAGDDATATVRLFNAGPATAHGLVATIDASGPIGSTDRPEDCTIDGSQAVCRLDELAVMGSADIAVTAATPDEGALTLSAETVQYQTDLDESSNAATASVPVVDDPADVDATPTAPTGPTTPTSTDGGDAGGSDSSGGGCSIASGSARDPLFGLLMMLGLTGFVVRRRRREPLG